VKTKADFQPDTSPPNSLRELVLEQLIYSSYDGKTNNPLAVQSVDDFIKAGFARIEQQALEVYQPNFTPNEIETLIWATMLDDIPANMVIRLVVATVYGVRRSELTEILSHQILMSVILYGGQNQGQC